MKDSRLTIQRLEGCPEWADLGVMIMVRDTRGPWQGPYQLEGFDPADSTFFSNDVWWSEAQPYIKWQPKPGEWVAFFDDGYSIIGQLEEIINNRFFKRIGGASYNHVARLVDDDSNLIDLRCSMEELKERTEWL